MASLVESAVGTKLQGLQMGVVYLCEIGDASGLEELRGELETLSHHPKFGREAEQLLSRVKHASRPWTKTP